MPVDLVAPAPALELVALFGETMPLKPDVVRIVMLQSGRAATVGYRIGGRMVAALGFWPLGGGCEEVFFVATPGAGRGPQAVALARAARLTLRARRDHGVVRLVAFVGVANRSGERLARLSGFFRAPGDAPAGFTRWEARPDGEIRLVDVRRRTVESDEKSGCGRGKSGCGRGARP